MRTTFLFCVVFLAVLCSLATARHAAFLKCYIDTPIGGYTPVAEQTAKCFEENYVDTVSVLSLHLCGELGLNELALRNAEHVIVEGCTSTFLIGGGLVLPEELASLNFNGVDFIGSRTQRESIFTPANTDTSLSFEMCSFSGFVNVTVIDLTASEFDIAVSFKRVFFWSNTNTSFVFHNVGSFIATGMVIRNNEPGFNITLNPISDGPLVFKNANIVTDETTNTTTFY